MDTQLMLFVTQNCVVTQGYASSTVELYAAYLHAVEGPALTRKHFVAQLRHGLEGVARYGVHWIEGKATRGFSGLGLKSGARPRCCPACRRPYDGE